MCRIQALIGVSAFFCQIWYNYRRRMCLALWMSQTKLDHLVRL
jgi:hypothetical protein